MTLAMRPCRVLILVAAAALAACPEPFAKGKLGDSCATNADCVHGLECAQGRCVQSAAVSKVCTPGVKRCDADTVVACKDDGTQWLTTEQCPLGCQASGSDASCIRGGCPEPPGQFRCGTGTGANELLRCRADGSGEDAVQICPLGCDPATTLCVGAVCRPGSRRCLGRDQIQVCRSDGTDFDTVLCSADAAIQCVSGPAAGGNADARCLATLCTPGAQRCDGPDVVRCAADGAGESYVTTCPFACAGQGECRKPTSCIPGERVCASNHLRVCNSLGTGFDEDVDCARGLDPDSGLQGVCVSYPSAAPGEAARCVHPTCTAGTVRCDGDRRVACAASGDRESLLEICVRGCDPATKACRKPQCRCGAADAPGCTDARVQRCAPDGGGLQLCDSLQRWEFAQYCSAGCVGDSSATPAVSGARCANPLCPSQSARCTVDPATGRFGVERCVDGATDVCAGTRPDGSTDGPCWVLERPCGVGEQCDLGTCLPVAAACQPDRIRCSFEDLQRCRVDGVSGYDTIGACLGTCTDGSCDAAGDCAPFGLSVLLAEADKPLPGDGKSTFLVVSDLVAGPGGRAAPDGTLFTISVDHPAVVLPSADADPDLPGLQVRAIDGRIDFVLRAPDPVPPPVPTPPPWPDPFTTVDGVPVPVPLTTFVRARVAHRPTCLASLSLTFEASVPATAACAEDGTCPMRYAAEDFTTTSRRDPIGGERGWDALQGTLTLQSIDAGDGRDGELVVASGATVSLTDRVGVGHTFKDVESAPVREIRTDRIAIDGSLVPFRTPGTRAMIVNLEGPPGAQTSVGAWEFVVLDGTDGGMLRLTRPLARVYGQGSNLPPALEGQAVRLVRVPQYGRVTVNGTLTAAGWDGTTGGILPFLAADGIVVGSAGRITMTAGIIVAAGKTLDLTASGSWPLWLASRAYSAGNQVINFDPVSARYQRYQCVVGGTSATSGGPTATGTNVVDGTVRWSYQGAVTIPVVVSGGGTGITGLAGGTAGTYYVHLRAGDMKLGTPGKIAATGGSTGRVRVEAVTIDAGFRSTWTSPEAVFSAGAPLTARSRPLPSREDAWLPETIVLSNVSAILLPVGKPLPLSPDGTVNAPTAYVASGLALQVSADAMSPKDAPVAFPSPWNGPPTVLSLDLASEAPGTFPTWIPNHLYSVGEVVMNGAVPPQRYVCTAAGKSAIDPAAGPSGTGADIADGDCRQAFPNGCVRWTYVGRRARWLLSTAGQTEGATRGMALKFQTRAR